MTAALDDLRDFSALLEQTKRERDAARRDVRKLLDQNGKLTRLALAVKAWRVSRFGTEDSRKALKVVDLMLQELREEDAWT